LFLRLDLLGQGVVLPVVADLELLLLVFLDEAFAFLDCQIGLTPVVLVLLGFLLEISNSSFEAGFLIFQIATLIR
jgi:hypothetical protein